MVRERIELEKVVKLASRGLAHNLSEKHPRLQGMEDYLDKYLLNKKALRGWVYSIIKTLNKKQRQQYTSEDIALRLINDIQNNPNITDLYLTERGKESILRKYERVVKEKKFGFIPWGKGILRIVQDIGAPKIDKYINEAVSEFGELNYLAQKYRGALTPKIENLLNGMYSLGFAYEAIDVMQHYKDLSVRDANKWRESVKSSLKRGKEEIKTGISETVSRYAASLLLIASFLLLGFSAGHMTGFAIAGNKIDSAYPIGAGFILLIIAFCFSFLKRKKKQVKQARKKAGRKIKKK